ncbi:LAMI_0H18228g1_1 [Lachancea mirantina]|uniref:LAMI_0H18228g1_1 n=1 Tax=Lachancea mirantina TaxID=1230905 RepID=A0A1G4KJE9_9SACH|nr:LAMI_0H18228g1_1 [Lachancea mirantina]
MKRGKGLKGQIRGEVSNWEPSKILSKILADLDLTYESDIGMLNGKSIRNMPSLDSLLSFQQHLEELEKSFDKIHESDLDVIRTITSLIEKRHEAAKQKETERRPGDTSSKNHSLEEEQEIPTRPGNRKRSLLLDEDEDEEHNSTEHRDGIQETHSRYQKQSKSEVDRIENDPAVKNPKSEFVVSQTLPAAAMTLGLFSEQGLESTGEEFFKQKFGVASYPTSDLKELMPGEIPDMDFSRPKPANQIQFNTFLASIDGFFREFTEEDVKFLKAKFLIPPNLLIERAYDPEVTPYVIPKLGTLYTDTWAKEDSNQNIGNVSPPPVSHRSSILPKKSGSDICDELLDTEEISCGPLVSRVLSAILKDETNETENIDIKAERSSQTADDLAAVPPSSALTLNTSHGELDEIRNLSSASTSALPQQQGWKVSSINLDYPTFEERLKRELKYVGIYMNLPRDDGLGNGGDPDWLNGREDDEISTELRELQSELRHVVRKNSQRKAALIPLVTQRLAWQEYSSILDDLDKQVDQAYIKRIRVPKNKRKKQQSSSVLAASTSQAAIQAAHQQAASSSLKSLLDKRRRWIGKIGPLFDKPEVMLRLPRERVFKDVDQDDEEEEGDVFGNSGNSKDDDLEDSLQNKE